MTKNTNRTLASKRDKTRSLSARTGIHAASKLFGESLLFEKRTDSRLTFKADDTKADMGVMRTLTRVASSATLPRQRTRLSSDTEAPTRLDRSDHTLCHPGRTRKALKPAGKANSSRRGSVLKSPSA